MPAPYPPLDLAPETPVCELDDQTLRHAHPLLNASRVAVFSAWMDRRLAQLERRYQNNITRRTLRKSLGR